MKRKIVIIGGVAGGATAAARLRRLNEEDEIVIFEKGEYISFANCGLPYHIGGVIQERDNLLLETVGGMAKKFNIGIKNFSEVVKINRAEKTITVKHVLTGATTEENYDKLIISTGAKPIKPAINRHRRSGERLHVAQYPGYGQDQSVHRGAPSQTRDRHRRRLHRFGNDGKPMGIGHPRILGRNERPGHGTD